MRLKNDEWYYERIIWKANKQNLFARNCIEFADLEKNKSEYIISKIPNNIKPILVFWGDYNSWTVLSIDCLVSYYDNQLVVSSLDIVQSDVAACIEKKYIKPKIFKVKCKDALPLEFDHRTKNEDNVKLHAKWLYLKNTKEYIWMPGPKETFALHSILLMLSRLK